MNFNNWKRSTHQNYDNPTECNQKERYCEICDIEESKTYFIEDTNICQDCKEEEEEKEYIKEYILPYETHENKNLYYEGCIQYDKEYIKEHKKYNTLFN